MKDLNNSINIGHKNEDGKMKNCLNKSLSTIALSALMVAPGVNAAVSTTGNNFTLTPPGLPVGVGGAGTNDIEFYWDETFNTDPATAVPNGTIWSKTGFFGTPWSAHDVTIYGPGTYTFNATCPGGFPACDGFFVAYHPDKDFNGTDTFTYTIVDANGAISTATVNMTITPINDPPATINDMLITTQDAAEVLISPLVNDSDVEGDTLTITGVDTTATVGGTASFTGTTVGYTPGAGFSGLDSFDYIVEDGNGGISQGRVNVAVNNPANIAPVGVDDAFTINEDVTKDFLNDGFLLVANDTDADPLDPTDKLVVIGATQPSGGGVVNIVKFGTSYRPKYTPEANWSGIETFTYTVADVSGGTDTATVTMTVDPANDAPLAVGGVTILTNQDAASPVSANPLIGVTDVEGDTITVASVGTASNGVATTDGAVVSYTPNAGFFGDDWFFYTISDGNGGIGFEFVTVAVASTAANTPPVAVTDSLTMNEDGLFNRFGKLVVMEPNDTDADGDTIKLLTATYGANGWTETTRGNNGGAAVNPLTVTVNSGQIGAHMLFDWSSSSDIDVFDLWEPNVFGNGTDNMKVCPVGGNSSCGVTTDTWSNDPTWFWDGASIDGNGDGIPGIGMPSNDGPFPNQNANFNVMGVWANAVPTAADDGCAVIELLGAQSCSGLTLPGDDTDLIDHPGIQTMTYSIVANGALGTATITDPITGAFTYDPGTTVGGPSVNDTFTYEVTDGVETSSIQTITVNIRTSNVAPTAPVQLSPTDAAMDTSATPTLVWQASTDADGDTIQYHTTVCTDMALTLNCVIDNDVLAGLSDNTIMIAGVGSAGLLLLGLTGLGRRKQYVQLSLLGSTLR